MGPPAVISMSLRIGTATRMTMNVVFLRSCCQTLLLLLNSPYERSRLDRKVEATDDGKMGNNDNDMGESKH